MQASAFRGHTTSSVRVPSFWDHFPSIQEPSFDSVSCLLPSYGKNENCLPKIVDLSIDVRAEAWFPLSFSFKEQVNAPSP